jgi:hypothetical protein
MDISKMYDPDACSIFGGGSTQRTRTQYIQYRKDLKSKWIQVVLVDMIGQPVEDSVTISNELFMSGKYPEGTYFCLYCHSGGSSGYVQKQLQSQLPKYNYINITGGIMSYNLMHI